MHFGGDCEGTMVHLPGDGNNAGILVMGSVHHVGTHGGIQGRSDYRLHRSLNGGASWTKVADVYSGPASYSSLVALNATHVGLAWNAGVDKDSMQCNATTQFSVYCV